MRGENCLNARETTSVSSLLQIGPVSVWLHAYNERRLAMTGAVKTAELISPNTNMTNYKAKRREREKKRQIASETVFTGC